MLFPESTEKSRILHCIIIAVIALFYYSTYYDLRIGMHDEGFMFYYAQRMLAGEMPYKDFVTAYGFLWHYPIVFLFNIFGATFNVMRMFWFGALGLAGVLSFYILDKITKQRVVAYVGALAIIAFHSKIYRALTPFAIILCIFVFIECNFWQEKKRIPF
ncbi:MAG: hypothetical protein LBH94_05085, partial [Deltaproteobacteria bacterium]|nr:hypothetical protein [Deltaproteobacteria bacterium]